jgi:rhodanese-related sulfurtransferase
MTQTMTREQLRANLENRVPMTLAEALPEKYYTAQHLPGAIHLPHDRVRELASSRLPDKDETIVVYCANVHCRNSHIAAQTLAQMGYRKVFVYAEGKQDWMDASLPTERDEEVTDVAH